MKLEDVIRRGTRAAQPVATAVAIGTLYYVTDETLLERSTGAAWENVEGVAGGAGSDTTAIHDDTSGEIAAVTEKVSPIGADLLLIEDSAATNAKKRVQITNLPAPTIAHSATTGQTTGDHHAQTHGSADHNAASDAEAIHDNVAAEISAVTEKVTPVNADLILIEDSAAANAKKRVQIGNLPGGGGGGIITGVPSILFEFDDFINIQSLTASLTSDKLSWLLGLAPSQVFSLTNHPGIINHAVSGSGTNTINLNKTAAMGIHPDDTFELYWIVRPTNATNVDYRFGLTNQITNVPTSGIYIESLAADTNWFLVTRAASSETRVDTGIARSAATWYQLRLYRKDASTIAAIVNAGSEVTSTTNIPSTSTHVWGSLNSTAGAQSIDIDYFSIKVTGMTRF